jgi:hypothetical protein
MRVAILQSNYLPWKGYFDLIKASDVVVVYDSVQYTKNDWRNRNRIATSNGLVWLTLPIKTSGRWQQSVRDAEVSDNRFVARHFKTLDQTYGKQPGYLEIRDSLVELVGDLDGVSSLHEINMGFIQLVCDWLAIETPFIDDREVIKSEGTASERVLAICAQLGATSYLTGPAGLNYLDTSSFRRCEIEVEVIDYAHYPKYPQLLRSDFVHHVSILDVVANCGKVNARGHLRGVIDRAPNYFEE